MICPACNCKYEESLTFCPKDGTALVPDNDQTESRVGQILADRYRIVRMLGEGGMGEVYEAEHIYIKKKVALKLLRNEITSNAEAVTRFHQEALSASTIGHENIVVIDDFGRLPDGSVYLTMEYLAGEPLSDLMLRGKQPPDRALDIVMQICRGLAAAHSKGIIHRDMKPENVYIVVDKDGTDLCKILDFGIAKVSSSDSGENLTRTGTIFGTPHYMSPEQAMGRQLDHRTDVYSVGVIMYELFTGTVPFKAESFMGILTQHITALPQPPRQCAPDRQIHPEIERIILTAMNKEPEKRYPSMVEFLEDLRNVKGTITSLQPAAAAAGAGASGGWGSASTFHSAVPPTTMAAEISGPVAALGATAPSIPPMITQPPMGSQPAMAAAHVTGPTAMPYVETTTGGGSKVGLIIAVLLVVLGGGGAGAYFIFAGGGGGGDKGKGAVAKADGMDAMDDAMDAMDGDAMDAMDAMGTQLPDAMEGKLPDAMDAMKTEPMGAMVPDAMDAPPAQIKIRTKPHGAKIYRNGEFLCTTTCKVSVPAGEEQEITIKREGFQDKTLTLKSGGPKAVTVKLTKVAVEPPPMRRAVMHPVMRRAVMRPVMRRRGSADPFGEGID
ncbi:MAG: serine/threonine-protein kinase [bacterium]